MFAAHTSLYQVRGLAAVGGGKFHWLEPPTVYTVAPTPGNWITARNMNPTSNTTSTTAGCCTLEDEEAATAILLDLRNCYSSTLAGCNTPPPPPPPPPPTTTTSLICLPAAQPPTHHPLIKFKLKPVLILQSPLYLAKALMTTTRRTQAHHLFHSTRA